MNDEEVEKTLREEPWLTCSEAEFEQFAYWLRRDDPNNALRAKAEKDGVDVEDIIIALRLARLEKRIERLEMTEKGTRH